MKILALETSAKAVSAAVTEDGKVLCSGYQDTGLTHSRTLMPLVDGMLSAAGLKAEDMDLLAAANEAASKRNAGSALASGEAGLLTTLVVYRLATAGAALPMKYSISPLW